VSQSVRAWVVCLTAGLFFFYEYIQMNMFNVISAPFMTSFHLSAQFMGFIDSFYFAANVIFLFVAGYLLDHFSIRRVILTAMMFCVVGTFCISVSYYASLAMIFRFLTGIGSAFCFLSCIRLSTHWFPEKQIGLVIGVILTEAMLGGIISQGPLTLLVGKLGWRSALMLDALLGLVLWCVLFGVVRDRPNDVCVTELDKTHSVMSYWHGFRQAFLRSYNWLAALYTGLINLPMALLGGLWGITYLVARFHVSSIQASWATTCLFVGMMLGSPVVGWLSDRAKSRARLMAVGSWLMLAVLLLFLKVAAWSYLALIVIFFAIGFLSGFQVISYPLVAQASPVAVVAMSVSAVNITVQGVAGLSRPVSGWLMDKHHAAHAAGSIFTASDYYWVMWGLPVVVVLSMLMVVGLHRQHKVNKHCPSVNQAR